MGTALAGDERHVDPDEVEQSVLSRIRSLRRAKKTLRAIAGQLNDSGFQTRRGTSWRHEHIKRIVDADR